MNVSVGTVPFHRSQLEASAKVPRVQPAQGQAHAEPGEGERRPRLRLGVAQQRRLFFLQPHAWGVGCAVPYRAMSHPCPVHQQECGQGDGQDSRRQTKHVLRITLRPSSVEQ